MIDLCQGPWPREGAIEELDAVIVNGNTPQDRSTDEGEQSGSPCISPSQISDCYLVEDTEERQKAQVKQRNQVSAEVSRSPPASLESTRTHSPGGVVIFGCHSEKRPCRYNSACWMWKNSSWDWVRSLVDRIQRVVRGRVWGPLFRCTDARRWKGQER